MRIPTFLPMPVTVKDEDLPILLVNQRVDLVQEQIDNISQLITVGCVQSLQGLCVTPVQWHNLSYAANISKELSKLLIGTWTNKFEN